MARRTSVFLTVLVGFVLSVQSVFLVYSASRRNFGYELAMRQSIWVLLGVIAAFVVARLSMRKLFRYQWVLYVSGVFLLLFTVFYGVSIRGERSWIDLGFFNVQPSEIMKPILLLSLAGVAERLVRDRISRSNGLLQLFGLTLLPVGLILLQPDAGTALIYLGFFVLLLIVLGFFREALALTLSGSMLTLGVLSQVVSRDLWYLNSLWDFVEYLPYGVAGMWVIFVGLVLLSVLGPYFLNERISVAGFVVLGISAFFGGRVFVHYLADYQVERIRVFLDPYNSPLRSGYNIIQSQIAIGSGGWLGQGYLQGSQSQLGFIPELWTDFIFTVTVEELGLFFGIYLITLFLVLVYSVFSAAVLSKDPKGYTVCAGIGVLWMVHTAINLGVCLGLIPVIGLPLPFTSYGGSFMLTNWIMIGLLIGLSGGPRTGRAY